MSSFTKQLNTNNNTKLRLIISCGQYWEILIEVCCVWMYIYVYIHTHISTYVCIHVYIHTYVIKFCHHVAIWNWKYTDYIIAWYSQPYRIRNLKYKIQ